MIAAIAIEVIDPSGKTLPNVVGKLETDDGMDLLMVLTNDQGYDIFKRVPLPFTGLLKLQANGIDGKCYSVPVSIPDGAVNVTLRVGGTQVNPQDRVLPAAVSFKRGSVLPAPPSRDAVCGVRNQLQGISVGTHHLFDPEIGWSTDRAFRLEAYAAHRAVCLPDGTPRPDTHVCLSLDVSGLACLPQIKAVVREAITEGGMTGVLLMCMGDGNDEGEPDHDSGALGFSWLMANFDAIVDFMEDGEDLTPWIVFGPGFDGIIPAWQPWSRVNQFVRMARRRLDRLKVPGYLNVELSSGYWSWSGERDDLGTDDGRMIDVVLYEYPIDVALEAPPAALLLPDGSNWAPSTPNAQRDPWTQIWIINRLIGTLYKRPSYQPRDYEPHPQYADATTPRGRKFFIIWERTTYLWTRKTCDKSIVDAQTQLTINLGAEYF